MAPDRQIPRTDPGADEWRRAGYTVPPGAFLVEWMQDTNTRASMVRQVLDLDVDGLLAFLRGKIPVTPRLALRLEALTGIPKGTWHRYEAAFRADLARLSAQREVKDDTPTRPQA